MPKLERAARLALAMMLLSAIPGRAADAPAADPKLDAIGKRLDAMDERFDELAKNVDDVLWFERMGDVAIVDKVYIATVPNPKETPTYGISNERHPFKMYAYVFTPRKLGTRQAPLIILPHGGVHADFTTYHTHILREMMDQGYVVVAPEYRGSTGYGRSYFEAID